MLFAIESHCAPGMRPTLSQHSTLGHARHLRARPGTLRPHQRRETCIHAFWRRRRNIRGESNDVAGSELSTEPGKLSLDEKTDQPASSLSLPPMVLELTVEKGSSLQDLAGNLNCNVDILVQANGDPLALDANLSPTYSESLRLSDKQAISKILIQTEPIQEIAIRHEDDEEGSHTVSEDTVLRFQHPMVDNARELGKLFGLKEEQKEGTRGSETHIINPLATEQNPSSLSGLHSRGSTFSPPQGKLLLGGAVILALAGMLSLRRFLTTASSEALRVRATKRRKSLAAKPSEADQGPESFTPEVAAPSEPFGLSSEPIGDRQGRGRMTKSATIVGPPSSLGAVPDGEESGEKKAPELDRTDVQDLQERLASNSQASTSSSAEGAILSRDPAWIELEQVYVVLSKHDTTPSYKLLPQQPQESQWIVCEDRSDAMCMLAWYQNDAKQRVKYSPEGWEWLQNSKGKVAGRVVPLAPLQCLSMSGKSNEGIAFVPAKSFVIELRMTSEEIWSLLATNSYVLPYHHSHLTEASVEQILESGSMHAEALSEADSGNAVSESRGPDMAALRAGSIPKDFASSLQDASLEDETQGEQPNPALEDLPDLLEATHEDTYDIEATAAGTSDADAAPSARGAGADNESAAQGMQDKDNPFEQFKGLGELTSRMLPGGADGRIGFDMSDMKERFASSSRLAGNFATIDVRPGGDSGVLTDEVPVPADMQDVWHQMQQIHLPKESIGGSVDEAIDFLSENLFPLVEVYSNRRLALMQQAEAQTRSDESASRRAEVSYRDFLLDNMVQETTKRLAREFSASAGTQGVQAFPSTSTTAENGAPRNTHQGTPSNVRRSNESGPQLATQQNRRSIRAWGSRSSSSAGSPKPSSRPSGENSPSQRAGQGDSTERKGENFSPVAGPSKDLEKEAEEQPKYEILDKAPEKLRSDSWMKYPQLFLLTTTDEDGMSHLALNLSDTVLLEDRHLICFADSHDAFGLARILRANGDETDFRVIGIEPETIKQYIGEDTYELGVTAFTRGELPLLKWQKSGMTVKELHDRIAAAARKAASKELISSP